jgi:glycosyltransferase involved in cell wall biosynthesis
MKPLLSVLIPTRNRAKELSSLLAIIENYKITDVEFIVSDNSDVSLTYRVIPSVSYIRPNRVLNMTDNWNWLLTHAQGKFITYLGDDDAFIPSELSNLIEYARKCTSDIIWTKHSGYGWPSEGNHGNFFLSHDNKSKTISIEEIRAKIMKLNHKTDLPTPYCRVIFNRKIIESFWRANPGAKFCSSRIPDISAAVKIAFLSNSQCSFDRVVFISGASKSSNGQLTRSGRNLSGDFQFDNLVFNPIYPGVLEELTLAPPFGYITWLEAFDASFIQLGLKPKFPKWLIAFRTVLYSSNVKKQIKISYSIWGNVLMLGIAYIFNNFYFVRSKLGFSRIKNWISIFNIRIGNKRSVVILSGRGLHDTFSLVNYLEKTKLTQSKKGIIKIKVP